jgi:hypothetical protein
MIDTLLDTAMDASTERLASKSKKNQVPAREANLLQPDQLDLELY